MCTQFCICVWISDKWCYGYFLCTSLWRCVDMEGKSRVWVKRKLCRWCWCKCFILSFSCIPLHLLPFFFYHQVIFSIYFLHWFLSITLSHSFYLSNQKPSPFTSSSLHIQLFTPSLCSCLPFLCLCFSSTLLLSFVFSYCKNLIILFLSVTVYLQLWSGQLSVSAQTVMFVLDRMLPSNTTLIMTYSTYPMCICHRCFSFCPCWVQMNVCSNLKIHPLSYQENHLAGFWRWTWY